MLAGSREADRVNSVFSPFFDGTGTREDINKFDCFDAKFGHLFLDRADVFGHHCSFSNYGSMVAVAAPGEYILSTSGPYNANLPNIVRSDCELLYGTSQSAPLGSAGIEARTNVSHID